MKQIKKPNIKLRFCTSIDCCMKAPINYFKLNNDSYLCSHRDGFIFFNKNGEISRLDGPAEVFYDSFYKLYAVNQHTFNCREFAEKTDHLICNNCKQFCKQQCF